MATVTVVPEPSPASKRLRLSNFGREIYPYPDSIPQRDRHDEYPEGIMPFLSIRPIPIIESSEWGSREAATVRACLADKVTSENEALIRTYHPSLRDDPNVCVGEERNGNMFWMVNPDTVVRTTHAAGREIHIHPRCLNHDPRKTIELGDGRVDPLLYPLNPRYFLSESELNIIRHYFPSAVGARVLISGYLIILFKTYEEILDSMDRDGFTSEYGGLRLQYDVVRTAPSVLRGSSITQHQGSYEEHAALGVKIRFDDGHEAITVPTHAFVKVDVHLPTPPRDSELFSRIKRRLGRFKPMSWVSIMSSLIKGRKLTNSPMNKAVYKTGESQPLGTITRTFDNIPPSRKALPFPEGFQHDLSLVTSNNLPSISTPKDTPQIVGWADYDDALSGHPVFIHRMHQYTESLQSREGKLASQELREAIIEGSQYTWNRALLSQNVSILWRAIQDGDILTGFSGTALCLGRLSDSTCRVLCFQNFQIGTFDSKLRKYNFKPPPTETPQSWGDVPRINGGFLLPREIKATAIVNEDASGRRSNYDTYPPRSSQDETALRRSFSSHQG